MSEGRKFDQNKPRIGFLLRSFPNAIEEVSLQNDYGAGKYDELNWMNVDYSRYEDALGRHYLAALKDAYSIDPESRQHHLAAVAWNALAMLQKIKGLEAFEDESETKNETKSGVSEEPLSFDEWCEENHWQTTTADQWHNTSSNFNADGGKLRNMHQKYVYAFGGND